MCFSRNGRKLGSKNLIDHRGSCAASSVTLLQLTLTFPFSEQNLRQEKKTVRSALADYVTLGHHSFFSAENESLLFLAETLIDIGASSGAKRTEDVMTKRESVPSCVLDKITISKAPLKFLIIENKDFSIFSTLLFTDHYSETSVMDLAVFSIDTTTLCIHVFTIARSSMIDITVKIFVNLYFHNFLSQPASTSESERYCSQLRLTVPYYRSLLKGVTINALLKYNDALQYE